MLIDVGCSSGIDVGWRAFGSRLSGFGFDPNVEEVARLNARERNPAFTYIPAFVGVPDHHPLAPQAKGNAYWSRIPWGRLSIAKTLELRQAKIDTASLEEKIRLNAWQSVQLADPDAPVFLPAFIDEKDRDVDFIKIDVDGADYILLQTLTDVLDTRKILGLCIEVNYFGSDKDTDHTFHNVDRLMKKAGFELFGLSVRTYAMAALPARYTYSSPSQSIKGRPLQGDAVYIRDIGAPEQEKFAKALSSEKLAKLAAVFALFDLPDCAAEVVLKHRDALSSLFDTDQALDILAHQLQPAGSDLSYQEYIQAFEEDAPLFYPT
ncbi:FkbM family methyltransferase [Azospirillum brasilense]|uniref:FkbM family methyltransferase n=1 Tax=Azospirillum brasilense TaxID=192 RepID=UPI001EDB8662|nr:FkbM family methyltransferase [Azospirillum brasilense]UKJ78129.1 FkbM family methyltransferase [Azospirillum brasilense]